MADPHTTPQAIFSLTDVHYAYGQATETQEVLRGVDFALYPGQRVGLYGPNGSGKTTFFRCITGLARPQRGAVRFHGRELRDEKDFYALRCAVGFVLQHAEDQLFFPTVLEDVAFGPLNLGLAPEAARERALETLHRLGLAGFEQRLTHRLSGGEKKLVSLATVLAMRPEALLLDEPTNGLDNTARERIIQILQGLDTARITISHDWDFLERTSSQYLTIDQGRLDTCAPSLAHAHLHAHPLGNRPHDHG
ncbi:energy-coupling factor ABC transporter ATP-binding protein [Desulfovibrio legallii]|uniref:Cobalt/nickel transport system ATP-binding protein n=1 Tax=Desulfovibrio legallii TaxID=571438 RepID=A0A1G7I6Z9_9BACT|nr:ABC transporter ATP-binding protein [Desulfovibrio legallii]SDF08480.1 cobalt/nickel transport system ATP-binding protein [Desulfovibrio legallii]